MSNDTTVAGWLTPTGDPPDDDEALERKLSDWILGLSGLPDGYVRPRWTPIQPPQLPQDTNWCAFGILGISDDANPAFQNQTDDSAEMWKHEQIECMASFYGPSSQGIGSQFRDGLMISQNNAQLNTLSLSLGTFTKLVPAPELINNQWVRRYDITIYLRRKLIRTYGIKTFLSAPVSFFGD
ncbi:phage neck terminator protein [Hafnia psychrotolerans]|uniref:Bacteriophage protein n=1 Tax=Hafnia psychrotolerans TaxID=1477018 RepID=A0ABQ1FZH0_9GAMM|nr:bacteriophage protein [Hafnia psychrotolerans]